MIVETFPVGLLACNATIVGDEETREAIVVDGGDGVDDVLARLKQEVELMRRQEEVEA